MIGRSPQGRAGTVYAGYPDEDHPERLVELVLAADTDLYQARRILQVRGQLLELTSVSLADTGPAASGRPRIAYRLPQVKLG